MELKQLRKKEKRIMQRLLIVPYGIETTSAILSTFIITTFNRTLWN